MIADVKHTTKEILNTLKQLQEQLLKENQLLLLYLGFINLRILYPRDAAT
jgi:hypothetical protein